MNIEIARKLVEAVNETSIGFDEVQAERPHDEGWTAIGEDYFVSPDGRFVAGPSGGNPTRTLARA